MSQTSLSAVVDPLPYYRIAFPVKKGLCFYPLVQLLYFRSDGNYTNLMLLGSAKEVFISCSMAKLESQLQSHFLRPHNQYLVNIMHIERMERSEERVELILTGGMRVTVSRNRRREVEGKLKML